MCIDGYEQKGRDLVIGDMNDRVGNIEMKGAVGKF